MNGAIICVSFTLRHSRGQADLSHWGHNPQGLTETHKTVAVFSHTPLAHISKVCTEELSAGHTQSGVLRD